MYALDADSGEVIWVNDETSAQYIKQPHSAESFAGVAPQGALAVTDHYVIVPGGRSVPAVLRRDTGELVHFHLNEGGKGAGGSTVIANDRHLYVHTRLRGVRRYDLASGVKTEVMLNEPVLHDRVAYTSTAEAISAINVDKEVVWEVAADGRHDLIRAGQRLYAAGDGGITVLASDDLLTQAPTVAQHIPIDGTPVRLVAASRHLVVVTQEGSILVFGDADVANVAAERATHVAEGGRRAVTSRPTNAHEDHAWQLPFSLPLESSDGYGIVYELADQTWIDRLLDNTELHLTIVHSDRQVVDSLRTYFDGSGRYGTRCAIHCGDVATFQAPPYIASLVAYGGTALSGRRCFVAAVVCQCSAIRRNSLVAGGK